MPDTPEVTSKGLDSTSLMISVSIPNGGFDYWMAEISTDHGLQSSPQASIKLTGLDINGANLVCSFETSGLRIIADNTVCVLFLVCIFSNESLKHILGFFRIYPQPIEIPFWAIFLTLQLIWMFVQRNRKLD